jgi:hypothetical protein
MGVQAARIPGPLQLSPADSLFPSEETEIGGIFVDSNLDTSIFKATRNSDLKPLCAYSIRLLGPTATPYYRHKRYETNH